MAGHPDKAWAPGTRHEVVPKTQEAGSCLISKTGTQVSKKSKNGIHPQVVIEPESLETTPSSFPGSRLTMAFAWTRTTEPAGEGQ